MDLSMSSMCSACLPFVAELAHASTSLRDTASLCVAKRSG
jgi:hypothetical protein